MPRASGRPLYAVDGEAWREIEADVVVAQEVCDVCAVSAGEVRRLGVEVVDYSPTTLDGIGGAILALGERLGAEAAARNVVDEMEERLRGVGTSPGSPRVFVAEWLDPPYAAGHWVPEMVRACRRPGRPGARR